jgi:hypothetical protein
MAHRAIMGGLMTLKIRSITDIFASGERILSAVIVAHGGAESGGVTALFMPAMLPVFRLKMDPLVRYVPNSARVLRYYPPSLGKCIRHEDELLGTFWAIRVLGIVLFRG